MLTWAAFEAALDLRFVLGLLGLVVSLQALNSVRHTRWLVVRAHFIERQAA